MWIKDSWEMSCSALRQLRDPDSDLRWGLRRTRQWGQYARRRLLFFRTPDVHKPGSTFAIAFQAYLSLAFALFFLVGGLEFLRFFLVVTSKTDWTPAAWIGAPVAGLAFGLALGFNAKAYVRCTRAATRAWARVAWRAQLMAGTWFAALAVASTVPVLLQRGG
jgi:hypothetical protein